MVVDEILTRARDDAAPEAGEIASLFEAPLFSRDSAAILAAAREKSERAAGGRAEVHGQVGLNAAPCPRNCLFCAFAACNGLFDENTELPVDEVVARSRRFETDGANGVFLMSTAQYPFDRFLEVGQEVRRGLRPETTLVANVGDMSPAQADRLRDAGFAGVYHALRMGEGQVTRLDPAKRIETMRIVRDSGLRLGTCVEPVGPEHTVAELVEKTKETAGERGMTVANCRRALEEAEWEVLEGPSRFYGDRNGG